MTVDAPDETPAAELREPRVRPGTWNVRVERLFWVVGSVLVAFGGTLYATGEQVDSTPSSVVAFAVLSAIGGWGLARWFGTRAEPARRVAWNVTALIWVLASWILTRVATATIPDASSFGSLERLMVAPAAIALLMVVAGRFALNTPVSVLAAILISASVFDGGADDGDFPAERVSTASAKQLATALDDGDTVLLRGVAHDPGAGVTAMRSANADRCRAGAFTDPRRTMAGLRAQTIHLEAHACWDKAGRPVSLTVRASALQGDQAGAPRTVPVNDVSAFREAGFADGRQGARDLGYGDRERDTVISDRNLALSPLRVRDASGRVVDDKNRDNDTVLARAEGDRVRVLVAYRSRDQIAGRSLPQDAESGRPSARDQERGGVLDIAVLELDRQGGLHARAIRYGRGGVSYGTSVDRGDRQPDAP